MRTRLFAFIYNNIVIIVCFRCYLLLFFFCFRLALAHFYMQSADCKLSFLNFIYVLKWCVFFYMWPITMHSFFSTIFWYSVFFLFIFILFACHLVYIYTYSCTEFASELSAFIEIVHNKQCFSIVCEIVDLYVLCVFFFAFHFSILFSCFFSIISSYIWKLRLFLWLQIFDGHLLYLSILFIYLFFWFLLFILSFAARVVFVRYVSFHAFGHFDKCKPEPCVEFSFFG